MIRVVSLLLCCLFVHGCYYMQAARGQLELNRARVPIEDVIASADTSGELARRLVLVQEARQFAVDELGLPDNDTYRSYADIERDFVGWSVFAAPEFSLQPKTWCFPIAGCVSYRGYFREKDAEREAERLAEQGYDVAVEGIIAYSTLGKLRDPVISSMMRWDDVQLVATLFHELAHQVLYVKGDSGFNESFATAVEEHGVRRWLAARDQSQAFEAWEARRELRQSLVALVDAARPDLEAIYAEEASDDARRAAKRARLATLQRDIVAVLDEAGRNPGPWVDGELNNARLIPMMLYEGRLQAFRDLLESCDFEMSCFYEKARELARGELQVAGGRDVG